MDLRNVDLFVLSACEGNLGETTGTDGALGASWAVRAAGARTCVSALWKISDAVTSELMSRFYSNLVNKQMSKLSDLREAQIWVLRNGQTVVESERTRGLLIPYRDDQEGGTPPYFWASFVLDGDWR